MPMADGEGRRVVLLGGEPGSGKSRLVREFAARGGRRRRARPLRRLRRGRAHAVRAVRRGARSPRRASLDPVELRAALGTARRRAHAAAPRSGGPGRRSAAAGRGRSGHRAPSAAHGGDRPPRRRQPRGRCCSCSRTGTGPTRRRSCSCVTWRGRPAGRACCCSPPSATPRPTSRQSLSETLADLRRSDDVVRLRLAGLSGEEVSEFVAARRAGRRRRRSTRARRTRSSELTGGQPVPRLRAVARPGRDAASSRSSTARSASPGR